MINRILRTAKAPLAGISFEPDHSRVHSLDGLRAVSVLLVVIAHYGLDHLVPGGLGVTTFFFISGFIITRLLLAELEKRATIDLAAFYRRRFWRLWPAVTASVIGLVLVGAMFGEWWASPGDVVSSLLFFRNYWGVVHPEPTTLGIHWSLAVEFHFYLVWPIALLVVQARPKLAVPVSIAALVVILLFRVWLVLAMERNDLSWDAVETWTYQLSHLRADSLLFGALLALMAFDERWRKVVRLIADWRSIWIGVAILLVTLVIRDEFFRVTVRYSIQGAALLLIFAGVLFAEQGGIARRLLNLPVMIWLGSLSFSIYLWHMVMWRTVNQFFDPSDSLLMAFIAAALTLVIAWLSYQHIEQRFIRLGRQKQAVGSDSQTSDLPLGYKTVSEMK